MNKKNELRKKVAAVNMHPNRNLLPQKEITKRYLICSSERSGSSLLADLLDRTSLAGRPLEYLNMAYIECYCKATNTTEVSRDIYWNDLQRTRSTENGVFGVKAHLSQIKQWLDSGDNNVIKKFLADFEYLIFIKRSDKLDQAISFYRAIVTGHWSSLHAKLDPLPAKIPPFNALAISTALQHVIDSENNWKMLFDELKLTPIEIEYETLVSNVTSTIHGLLAKMGINNESVASLIPSIVSQHDNINVELRKKYAEFSNEVR